VAPPSTRNRRATRWLGICKFAAVSFGGESVSYPGGALKEDEYYFTKKKSKCDDSFHSPTPVPSLGSSRRDYPSPSEWIVSRTVAVSLSDIVEEQLLDDL
jgi:hypothetical protein